MSRRVVVTGLGAVTPLGNSVEENWKALIEARNGIAPICSFPTHTLPVCIAGEVKDFKPRSFGIHPKSLKVMNKTIQYALAGVHLALGDARLNKDDYEPSDVGIAWGVDGIQYSAEEFLLACYEAVGKDMKNYVCAEGDTAHAPIKTRDPGLAVHPLWPLSVLANMALCHIAIQHNLQGPNIALSSIDASGAQAISEAFKAIRRGGCDLYVAGGSYGLNTMHILSFASSDLLSTKNRACMPFDRERDGCILGEGGAALVLEDLGHAQGRGAPIYAEIVGSSFLCDGAGDRSCAQHSGTAWKAMSMCISSALQDAGLLPGDIDFIHASGSGTAAADSMEASAIEHVFGQTAGSVPVAAGKALTGHMLPASGAFDALATVLSIRDGCIPPTKNHTETDTDRRLNIITKKALKKEIKYAISNTFGFSGEHVALVFKKFIH